MGTIRLRTTFVDNLPHGDSNSFSEHSAAKMYTWRRGRVDGVRREWYTDGALHLQGAYLGKEACGEWFHFTEDGRFVLYRFTRDLTADELTFIEEADRKPDDPELQAQAQEIFRGIARNKLAFTLSCQFALLLVACHDAVSSFCYRAAVTAL